MNNILRITFTLLIGLLVFASPVSAHVVVKPNQVSVASFQTFTVGVPVERELAVTQVRLVLPNGLNYVTPNVKSGWNVEVKKSGEGEDAKATEIIWSGNVIPAGFREEFSFSAQVPAEEAKLAWIAYQTYEDGSVVAWEKDPAAEQPKDAKGEEDFSKFGPFSVTKVINDLAAQKELEGDKIKLSNAFAFSIVAFVLGVAALGMQLYKRKQ